MTVKQGILALSSALVLGGCAHLATDDQARDDDPGERETRAVAGKVPMTGGAAGPGLVFAEPPRVTEVQEQEPESPYPDDLWARIRDGYKLESDFDSPRVTAELDSFARNESYIQRVAERAEPYLHFIVNEIDERDLPMEMALLPVVESAYRPFAYSHGRAAGIWQFVPATGRHFGLRQTWWYDGRRDVIASTEAALDYLEHLGELFDGDWELALAAYNAGQGRVLRTVRAAENQGQPSDYWNLDNLPRETRQYVPRLLAISALIKDPEAYGVALPSIADEPYLEVVDVGSQIDLALAAEKAGLSIEELYRLNPGYNRWATDPDGPHRIVLPRERADGFREALAGTSGDELMRWQRHHVQSGESLGQIASRYNTTVSAIQEANNLDGHIIRAGSHLLVPTASGDAGEYALSAGNRRASQQDRQRSGQRVEHRVSSGDTFWDLSRQYGVDVRELASWNNMAPGDTLRPGDTLVVWTDRGGQQVATSNSAPQTRAMIESVRYRVRSGDSVYSIAQRFNVSVSDVKRWNDITPGSYLQPGDTLTLKVDVRAHNDSI